MAELKVFTKMLILLVCTIVFIKRTSILCASEVKCLERERQALLKFKHDVHVVGRYYDLSSWGSGEGEKECCKWEGVGCSNKTGNVIRLDLDNYFNGGKINSALLELRHLEYLDLSFNNLRVDNLEWISHLSALRYLNLSGNNLHETNNWLQQISKLSFLEVLHLFECQLPNTLHAFDTFLNSSMSSLRILDLSDNYLSSFTIFGSLFNSSPRLTEIDLSYNQFSGPIHDSFGSLHFLEVLRLDENMLNEIPLSLGNLSHLRFLILSYNSFNQPLDQVFQNLSGKASKSLEYIHLSFNRLVGSLSDITHFPSLRTLVLAYNQLIEFNLQSPSQPSSLEIFDLHHNKIGGSLRGLKAYSSLQTLALSGNQIKHLPESIGQFSKLQYLDLSSNSLEGIITEDHLSYLTNLNYLDLSNNSKLSLNMSSNWRPPFQLTDLYLGHCNVGPAFPKWVQTQTSTLVALVLPFAGISSTLPSWLWDISSLLRLDLSHNNISGRIPHPLTNVPDIPFIDFSDNNLSGPIPLFLFHSIDLRLSKNKFFGSIAHLCKAMNHSNIRALDLSANKLTGELRNCWTNISSLEVVNLANNNLSGRIPSTLGNMLGLHVLHLRNNSFVGELPRSLKNCIGLEMLDVGGNKLTGTIPQWIGTHLRNLTILSLRFNQFHGSIDTTICYLTNIEVLDLSRNNLLGKIPECFNSFTSLLQKNSSTKHQYDFGYGLSIRYSFDDLYTDNILIRWKGQDSEHNKLGLLKGIDLSNNKLVGTIPREFSDLRGLVFLNLSRNYLNGNIMSNIGQMEMLEWLDLSRNELYGAIPNSLAELHFLSILDLSYNKLTGKIPLGTQLQRFNDFAYAGNSQLCGPPLPECPWDSQRRSHTDHGDGNNVEEVDRLVDRDFYISSVFGFITGFWIVVGALVVKHSWRQSYFNFWGKIGDWMYVTSAIYMVRFERKCLA